MIIDVEKDLIASYIEQQYLLKFNTTPRFIYTNRGLNTSLYYNTGRIDLIINKKDGLYDINYNKYKYYYHIIYYQFDEVINKYYQLTTLNEVYDLIDYIIKMIRPSITM